MRIAAAAAALLATAVAALPAAFAGEPAPPATAARTTSVGVAEREFRIAVYRPSVRAGSVRFNVRNFGEDVHNLVVRGPRGFKPVASGDIRSGQTATVTARLRRPGRYLLLCTKRSHDRLGMKAVLRVRR